MKRFAPIAAALPLCLVASFSHAAEAATDHQRQIDRGRYIVQTSGCNDCHTAGYMPSLGEIPESDWLLGDTVGWRGPWGTTYAINLRRYASRLTEDNFVTTVRSVASRPPMPWWALRQMDEADVRALYAYIRSLPLAGEEAPAYLPPDQEPATPYFTMVFPE